MENSSKVPVALTQSGLHAVARLLIESAQRQAPGRVGSYPLDGLAVDHPAVVARSIKMLEELANDSRFSRATQMCAREIVGAWDAGHATSVITARESRSALRRGEVFRAMRSDLMALAVSCEVFDRQAASTSIVNVLCAEDPEARVNILIANISLLGGAPNTPPGLRLACKIVTDKYHDLRGVVANLGSGDNPMPNAVNVDIEVGKGTKVVADAAHLPFRPGSIDEMHAINPHGYSAVNDSVAESLKPGGTLFVSGHVKRNKYVRPERELGSSEELSYTQTQPVIPDHDFGQSHRTSRNGDGSRQPIQMNWEGVVTHVLSKPVQLGAELH